MESEQLELNDGNYFSSESARQYMSVSQFKRFLQCEARAMAELRGEWHEKPSDALMIGSYVDCLITEPEKLPEFMAANPKLFQKNGTLYAKYDVCQRYVDRLKNDPLAWSMLNAPGSTKQLILKGEIAGATWKGKLDVLHSDKKVFIDLKTTRSLDDIWDDNSRKFRPWYEPYWIQMAVYRELLRQQTGDVYTPIIIAVSKQDPPAIAGVCFAVDGGFDRFRDELDWIHEKMPKILRLKSGNTSEQPTACMRFDSCPYCREVTPLKMQMAKSVVVSSRGGDYR